MNDGRYLLSPAVRALDVSPNGWTERVDVMCLRWSRLFPRKKIQSLRLCVSYFK